MFMMQQVDYELHISYTAR